MKTRYLEVNHTDICHKELLGQLKKPLCAQLTQETLDLSKWAWYSGIPQKPRWLVVGRSGREVWKALQKRSCVLPLMVF